MSAIKIMPYFAIICSALATGNNLIWPQNKRIFISFEINHNPVKIDNRFKMLFINDKDTQTIKTVGHQRILPSIGKDTGYTIIFIFKRLVLSFAGITRKMIFSDQDVNWIFGIETPPFNKTRGILSYEEYETNKKLKQIQYLQFDLMEHGDGREFVHKIE